MPILIQDTESGKYAAPGGRWTKDVAKALRFEQVLRAWDEIGERSLSGVRILFWPERERNAVMVGAVEHCATSAAAAM
jgi:hypothetical protein